MEAMDPFWSVKDLVITLTMFVYTRVPRISLHLDFTNTERLIVGISMSEQLVRWYMASTKNNEVQQQQGIDNNLTDSSYHCVRQRGGGAWGCWGVNSTISQRTQSYYHSHRIPRFVYFANPSYHFIIILSLLDAKFELFFYNFASN